MDYAYSGPSNLASTVFPGIISGLLLDSNPFSSVHILDDLPVSLCAALELSCEIKVKRSNEPMSAFSNLAAGVRQF